MAPGNWSLTLWSFVYVRFGGSLKLGGSTTVTVKVTLAVALLASVTV